MNFLESINSYTVLMVCKRSLVQGRAKIFSMLALYRTWKLQNMTVQTHSMQNL